MLNCSILILPFLGPSWYLVCLFLYCFLYNAVSFTTLEWSTVNILCLAFFLACCETKLQDFLRRCWNPWATSVLYGCSDFSAVPSVAHELKMMAIFTAAHFPVLAYYMVTGQEHGPHLSSLSGSSTRMLIHCCELHRLRLLCLSFRYVRIRYLHWIFLKGKCNIFFLFVRAVSQRVSSCLSNESSSALVFVMKASFFICYFSE